MDTILKKKITDFFKLIISEAEKNEEFATSLSNIFEQKQSNEEVKKVKKSIKKRDKAVIDPIKLAEEEKLTIELLEAFNEKELKDIIAGYGMDSSKLAMKWKDKDRLKKLIFETSYRRANKGSAFRS